MNDLYKICLYIVISLVIILIIFVSPIIFIKWKKYYNDHVCYSDAECISPSYNQKECYNFSGATRNNPNNKTMESFDYSYGQCQCIDYVITNMCGSSK